MATAVSIQTVGDWKAKMQVPLSRILVAATDIFNQSSEKVCYRTLYYMLQSARKLTPQSKKKRKILRTDLSTRYFEKLRNGGRGALKVYEWQFSNHLRGTSKYRRGTFEDALVIKSRGLGKRSWMWGLGEGKPIPGAAELQTIRLNASGLDTFGLVLRNKISYIEKIMPSGWRELCEQNAAKRIMAQAAKKLERQFAERVRAV